MISDLREEIQACLDTTNIHQYRRTSNNQSNLYMRSSLGLIEQITVNKPKARDRIKSKGTFKYESMQPEPEEKTPNPLDNPEERENMPNNESDNVTKYKKTLVEKKEKKGFLCNFFICFSN
jgi:hypothetical protein